MRIVSGQAKGLKLKMVPGSHVRPTSDRVKESLFHLVGPYFSGGNALDLFAGTGALGIEALSRGMDHVTFVDKSYKSIQTIKKNIELTKMDEKASVIKGDARQVCSKLEQQKKQFDLIFLDPPYEKGLLIPVLEIIATGQLMLPQSQVVAELPKNEYIPDQIGKMSKYLVRHYGNTAIYIYTLNHD